MNKKFHFNAFYLFFAILGVFYIREAIVSSNRIDKIPFSVFQEQLKANNISEITVDKSKITGKFKSPLESTKTEFITIRIDQELARDLEKYDVKIVGLPENTLFKTIIGWVIPIFIFFIIWTVIMRVVAKKGGMGGSFMTIGKSKAKIYMEQDTKVTFADVAGVDEAKEELEEIIEFLKNPKEYGVLGARMPKGVLLIGPPGTGKTLLAKAVAGEAAVPFFFMNGSEFVELFVGVGAARVRDLFDQARQKAPCIVFIDELDALGRVRSGAQISGGHDEKEQTLNQLLVEMDGFDQSSGAILLAATNRPEILDPALLRAGRFDRQVLVDRPDKKGRIDILNVHLKKIKKLDKNFDPDQTASMTAGFSGADLENLVNESALMATRRKAEAVAQEDFTKAMERIVAGLEKKNRILIPKEKKTVAYHEMGHALVAASLPGTDRVHKISIIPRGISALGYTIQRPTEDRFLMTKEELEEKICVLLGGRAAETVIFKHLSTGAADDLAKATDIAKSMVLQYGMDENVGFVNYNNHQRSMPGIDQSFMERHWYSEETANKIDHSIQQIIQTAFDRAKEILTQEKSILIKGAELLLKKETLDEHGLKEIFDEVLKKQKTTT